MVSKPSIDLLIIGAGPVGLAAAIEAQRLGLSCRIVERKEKRSDHDSRAVVIHPRMMELLEAHPGMIQNVNKRASILPCMNMELINVKTTITILKEEQRFGDTEYKGIYLLPQYLTEKSLEEVFDDGGGKVEYGIAFESLTQTEGEVTVKVKHASGENEDITAKYVMGADGGRSKVRDSVGITLERIHSFAIWALSDVKLGENSPHKELIGAHIMLTKGGPCVFLPLPDGRFRLFFQAPLGISKDNTTLDKNFYEKQIREMTGKEFELELGKWQSMFELTHGVSDAYRKGRVFLAGDAAHIHSPVGGQGMNYGIWDAVTLVSKLAWAERVLKSNTEAKESPEKILASYEEERYAMGQELVSNVKLATSVVTTRNPYLQFLRNSLIRIILPRFKSNMMRIAGQLDLAYKPSYSRFILPAPTSWFMSKSYICYPGQRLPNLVLEDGSKLYKQVDRARYTWICVNLTKPAATADRCVHVVPAKAQTSVPAISEKTLAKPQVILVRPDLFVAAVDDTYEKLEATVKKVFGSECYAAM